ncbi:L-rhamnose mutarotase [Mucilaginibacter sp. X5P1]|uniref:L-rhamnose mutarotase n=1 Tax=Mucilaginibacter sp. X5P1 TaxID=2723088 RepID=UPI001615C102|nr:L-rhamnose mutarotase [Mucilaginibacter sp. X5P1]
MERVAFKMKLKPGCELEYKRRHDQIWPELKALLKKVGISDYSIFLDNETNILFGTLKVKNMELYSRLSSIEVMRKWWDYMSDISETNADNSPVTQSLEEVFYLL